MTFKKTFLPAIILTLICLVMGAAVALANELTKDRIARVEQERYLAAAREALPADTLTPITVEGVEGFIGKNEAGEIVGYVIKRAARGYGGDVSCVVGIDPDGVIVGLSVSAPDETPGLGINVQKKDFTDTFLGLGVTDVPTLGDNVDGVTSATYSSRAVELAVKAALADFELLTKGGEGS